MKSKQFISALFALVVVSATGWFAWSSYYGSGSGSSIEEDVDGNESLSSQVVRDAQRVTLTDVKLRSAGIRTEPVKRGDLMLTRALPARFLYDDSRHVSLRTPTDGILESVLVKTGDRVDRDQPVAVLRSPSIGAARNRILASQTDLALAKRAYRWEADIHDGVAQLAKLIRAGESVEAIKKDLGGMTLGDFGGQLLTAYSKSKLASSLAGAIGDAADRGAVSGRLVQQRLSEQQQTESELAAVIEQSLFQTQQSLAKADAQVRESERALTIAQQTLGTLLGATANSTSGLDVSPNDPDVSRLTIKSPMSGTVELKAFSATERVKEQDELFVIADTTGLWIEADIRGRDWSSINVTEGDTVMVLTPSVNAPPQTATVYFLGRQVDPNSGAIPLVAQIDNTAGHFRPGLFARMEVPTQTIVDAIVVPESAVVDLDGQASVFVVDGDGFSPVAVELGSRTGERVEIRSGLSEGQAVVVAGAFALKSELLLEGEE